MLGSVTKRSLSKLWRVSLHTPIRFATTKLDKESTPWKYDEVPIDIAESDPIGSHIDGLVEEILNLNVVEYGQFLKRIQLRMGIADEVILSRLGSTMLIPDIDGRTESGDSGDEAGDDDGSEVEAKVEAVVEAVKEKEFFDIKLGAVDPKSKIKIIKEVRTITSLGLKEAKELVEKAPVVIKTGLKKEEADKLVKLLVECGAVVELL